MKNLSLALLLAAVLTGCGANSLLPAAATQVAFNEAASPVAATAHETILLVSLDDGSVIKQTIHSSADLCFKNNRDSSTTCLTQGDPVIDPVSNTVVGYEMIEERIELVAKSD